MVDEILKDLRKYNTSLSRELLFGIKIKLAKMRTSDLEKAYFDGRNQEFGLHPKIRKEFMYQFAIRGLPSEYIED